MHLILRTRQYRGHVQVDRLSGIPKRTGEAIDTLRAWRRQRRVVDDPAASHVIHLGRAGIGDALQFVSLIPEVVCRVPQLQRGNPIYCTFAPPGELVRRSLSAHDVKVVSHEVPRLPA
ncbi:hypothetical protein E2553_27090 [Paraburkholderia dipogonis]|uniref:Uncharacterized protein n=1 Tax=Paraburkholderia dipogonis TaxID=1211383 RepID=A0A4Y8MSQ2_9BURK|nr:hypothetical protein [Paraburkholderia dipogonis]TFE40428.1 hypothetical protein E2553_27090 [Paraburkholderia dipogonis]